MSFLLKNLGFKFNADNLKQAKKTTPQKIETTETVEEDTLDVTKKSQGKILEKTLKEKGYSDEQIEQYFDKDGSVYTLKSGIEIDGREITSEEDLYEALFQFVSCNNGKEWDYETVGFTKEQIQKYFTYDNSKGGYVLKDGIEIDGKSINTIDELKEYCGANSRKELLDAGIPNSVIDKYFELAYKNEGGTQSYENSLGYDTYKVGHDSDGNKTITFSSDTESMVVTVNSSGEIISTKTEKKNPINYPHMQHAENGKVSYPEEHLKQGGFPSDLISEYFEADEYEEGNYVLKEPYSSFKLVSESENSKVFQISYKDDDGTTHTTTIKTREKEGGYSVSESSINYNNVFNRLKNMYALRYKK